VQVFTPNHFFFPFSPNEGCKTRTGSAEEPVFVVFIKEVDYNLLKTEITWLARFIFSLAVVAKFAIESV